MRITAGSSGTLTGNNISLNLVQGTGAPVPSTSRRRTTPPTANLTKGAGVRLIGAAASVLAQNNITTNAYGVFNATLDGATANSAVPVKAENNWWGLRPYTGAGTTLTNTGPAISPTTNPIIPENPVNGAPVADGAGNDVERGRLLPVPQRQPGRPEHRRVHQRRRPGPGQRRGADRRSVQQRGHRSSRRQRQADRHAGR